MGTKKKKNSNYVTEKTIQAKLMKERAAKKKKIQKIALIATAIVLAIALAVVSTIGIVKWIKSNNRNNFDATYHASITIKDYGTVHVELFGNEAPITVANFVKLANEGKYNGTTFHRIIDGFMAQGGSISGASTITGEFENNGVDNPVYIERGVIAMARANDPDSASSQFFIVQDTEGAEHLNGDYAGFGKVTSGMDIIDQICKDAIPYDNTGSILPSSQPIITSITVHSASSH